MDLGPSWLVNLLQNETYYRYLRDPGQFAREARQKISTGTEWILLDEVQRIPPLLDEVQDLMESTGTRFILSGSSARKLKRGNANLLGGRAFLRRLHPFTVKELGDAFDLERALIFGTLPPILGLDDDEARQTLKAYVEIYLREEIQLEGIVRNLGGYTRFLDVAAAYSGGILNFSAVSVETSLPVRTVQSYFEILEDTLIGIRLPPWTKSPLKRLVKHPKFYLFDNGLTNALTHRLTRPLNAADRGMLFEQFIVQETSRRVVYSGVDASLYFWRTNNGAEVDLLIEKDGTLSAAVEIKSRPRVDGADLSGLRSFHEEHPQVPCIIVCTAPEPFTLDFVQVMPWKEYLGRLETSLSA